MKKLTLIASAVLGLSTLFAGTSSFAKTNEFAVIDKTENANSWKNVKKGKGAAFRLSAKKKKSPRQLALQAKMPSIYRLSGKWCILGIA